MNGTLSPTVDKICRIIGYTIGAAIVAIPLIALISSDLTLGEIVSWCMNSFGWLLIAAVAIPLILTVLVAVFLWLLPYLWIGFGLLGILLLANGFIIGGILCLAVAGVIGIWLC